MIARLYPRTVAGQLTGLVVSAVLIGVTLASAVMFWLLYAGGVGPTRATLEQVRAARIAAIVHGVQSAPNESDARRIVKSSREPVAAAFATPAAPLAERETSGPLIADIERDLKASWGLNVLPHERGGPEGAAIYVGLSDGRTLRFQVTQFGGVGSLVLTQALCTLAVITLMILFVSAYAVRGVTAPLRSIATAASAFGRPGGGSGDGAGAGEDLPESGPREVKQAARALNEMRKRVRSLVDERTRMLTALSHDLRTPLTRLRLRVERLGEEPARAAMLGEIAVINDMLSETLAYIREAGRNEAPVATDLPSLVQTVCAQFADIGHDVVYRGPDRLALPCRPHAVTRAIANLVDNATKFGSHVEVSVEPFADDVRVEVRDDGPGVAAELKNRVFEPFFKIDNARARTGGFGLGLSIVRDIADAHGGVVELLDAAPRGSIARLTLPLRAPVAAAA